MQQGKRSAGIIDTYEIWFRMEDLADDLIDEEAYRRKYIEFYFIKNYKKEEAKHLARCI